MAFIFSPQKGNDQDDVRFLFIRTVGHLFAASFRLDEGTSGRG